MTQIDLGALNREWTRFESWLMTHSPSDQAALRRPVGRERQAELESRLGFALHPELKALLDLHDGAAEPVADPSPRTVPRTVRPAGSFLPLQHRLCSVDDMAMMHGVLIEISEDFVEAGSADEEELAANLHRCVPFALPDDGGVALIDHRPGPSYGHVYEMGIGSGDLDGTFWATGLTELFRALSDALETGTPFLHYWPGNSKDELGRSYLEWEIRV
ncbi:SMI1/KNR4 family protein [Streptomyces sp. NPDC050674]|uniref:SMI1/KNR4 family protein n=1 Tax=Streptomyces sp. NPDC050674 TaxID=3157216 RepID=UPI00344A4B4D